MAYSEKLAERMRTVLDDYAHVIEIKMFGGLCFTIRGHMCCGIIDDHIVLRLGEELATNALKRKHVTPMDFTGAPIKSMVYVLPPGIRTKAQLAAWIDHAAEFVATLPPKKPKNPKPRKRAPKRA